MPIYEYKCDNCGKNEEVAQRFNDAPPFCLKCGVAMRKLISNSSFILQGGGWYKDGYSNSGKGAHGT